LRGLYTKLSTVVPLVRRDLWFWVRGDKEPLRFNPAQQVVRKIIQLGKIDYLRTEHKCRERTDNGVKIRVALGWMQVVKIIN
jgi:hypothetical protein